MILPRPLRDHVPRRRPGDRKNTDFRLMSITASQSASVKSTRVGAADDAGVVDEDVEPAELADASASTMRCDRRDASTRSASIASEAAAERLHRACGLVGARAADGGDVRAGPGQRQAMRLADAGVGAGDERDPAGKIERVRHARSFQLADVEHVHVGVVLVLAAHRPDEGVVAWCPSPCGSTRAARSPPPRWRRRCAASSSRLAHEVEDAVARARGRNRNRSRERRSCRCGGMVFQTLPGLSTVRPISSCARLADRRDDVLVDRALVRFPARRAPAARPWRSRFLGLVARMRRRGGEVELGRVGRIGRRRRRHRRCPSARTGRPSGRSV